jgi:hypothetical protein
MYIEDGNRITIGKLIIGNPLDPQLKPNNGPMIKKVKI